MTDWCVLLPGSSSNTLRLLDTLAEANFDVWAPVEHRKEKGKEPERVAILPGFLFGRADRLFDLHDLIRSPVQIYRVWDSEKRKMVVKSHPFFRLLRNEDGYALVHEHDLAHLRRAEQRRKPRGQVKTYAVGDPVKLTAGAYGGLRGVVAAIKGKEATVSFPGCCFVRDAQVPMWLLLDDAQPIHVSECSTERASIARAA